MRPLRLRHLLWFILFSGVILGSTVIPLFALPQPSVEFYVRDDEGLLSPQTEARIIQVSAELARKTKAQVVVLTTPGFDGMDSSEYALTVLREWGIGDPTLNNGVLILLSLGEGLSRIEVGYGLEGALPDSVLGRIQDDYMLPYYNDGDFDDGMLNGYMAVVKRIAIEYDVTLSLDEPVVYGSQPDTLFGWPEWVWIVIIVGLVLILDIRFLNGNLMSLVFQLVFSGGGRSGGFGGFGGSGGGGGASRRF
jgi:uncharacterized protein